MGKQTYSKCFLNIQEFEKISHLIIIRQKYFNTLQQSIHIIYCLVCMMYPIFNMHTLQMYEKMCQKHN